MRGRLLDLSMGLNGKQRLSIELDMDFREGYQNLLGADVNISIKKWRNARSRDANAYFHLLVNEIASARGMSDDEVKRWLVVEYGTPDRDGEGCMIGFKLPQSVDPDKVYPYTKLFKQVEENGKMFNCYLVYKRSSEMDTKEMSRLIDGAVYEAQELGLDTDTPEQKARFNL